MLSPKLKLRKQLNPQPSIYMKIKFYIITYNNNEVLNNWILKSLYNSDYERNCIDVYVIDNHTNAYIDEKYKDFTTLIPNLLRPNNSHGFLARSHNQAIINGFVSLDNPDCDYVISCQNDTILDPKWYQVLLILLKKYKYISQGSGDQFQVFSTEAIKHIGLYDERFSGIGWQDHDYFLRVKKYFGEFSTITDKMHGQNLNPMTPELVSPTKVSVDRPYELRPYDVENRFDHYHIYERLFKKKWGTQDFHNIIDSPPLIESYMFYPWFEKSILTLNDQKFLM